MNKTSGLGRGLSSLIPNKKIKDEFEAELVREVFSGKREEILELPVEQLSPNPHQPRIDFDEAALNDLAESIKEHGIIQPLIVTKVKPNHYQLIAGERRWRAAKMLKMETVPAIVRDFNEQKKLELALIENIQRRDLNAIETAIAYQKLMTEFNLDQRELSQKVGKSQSAIANTLRILNTISAVQEAVKQGKVSEGHARVLAGLPAQDQASVLKQILLEDLNVRETEQAGKEIVVKKHLRKISFDPDLKDKQDKLEQALGTKVEIKKFGSSGQIVIRFFSEEELEKIFKLISRIE
ncbi:MAG TPA: ParB/RepB/Spo0J family partition protein [bacterium]|nr:ParB/RepB/Spo0J family partition protein [bacterium]HPN80965.1 ParB/RepB/Spo0J family partition protein [bacterium]HPW39373.1 ParB/RepB/Spo0J family partition protein [bacterium]HQA63966.1 ParB/RepB/Spo0J family partition protein [bacterium]